METSQPPKLRPSQSIRSCQWAISKHRLTHQHLGIVDSNYHPRQGRKPRVCHLWCRILRSALYLRGWGRWQAALLVPSYTCIQVGSHEDHGRWPASIDSRTHCQDDQRRKIDQEVARHQKWRSEIKESADWSQREKARRRDCSERHASQQARGREC